jgi:hypothetical protein
MVTALRGLMLAIWRLPSLTMPLKVEATSRETQGKQKPKNLLAANKIALKI